MEIKLIKHPTEDDWFEVKRRAFATVGKVAKTPPSMEWKRKILEARHSPIRYLMFSFELNGIPTKVSAHLVRHVHSHPYVESHRNDRQEKLKDEEVNRLTPVNMIFDVNAEELMTIANKRLCKMAEFDTRSVVAAMMSAVLEECPEFVDQLVPMCIYHGGTCHEIKGCGKFNHREGLTDLYGED